MWSGRETEIPSARGVGFRREDRTYRIECPCPSPCRERRGAPRGERQSWMVRSTCHDRLIGSDRSSGSFDSFRSLRAAQNGGTNENFRSLETAPQRLSPKTVQLHRNGVCMHARAPLARAQLCACPIILGQGRCGRTKARFDARDSGGDQRGQGLFCSYKLKPEAGFRNNTSAPHLCMMARFSPRWFLNLSML